MDAKERITPEIGALYIRCKLLDEVRDMRKWASKEEREISRVRQSLERIELKLEGEIQTAEEADV